MTALPFDKLWDVCLENLPQGLFERRAVDAPAARARVSAARKVGMLRCAAKDDLVAPTSKSAGATTIGYSRCFGRPTTSTSSGAGLVTFPSTSFRCL